MKGRNQSNKVMFTLGDKSFRTPRGSGGISRQHQSPPVVRRTWQSEGVAGSSLINFMDFAMTFRGCLSVLLLCVVSVRSDVDDEEKGEL